MLSEKFYISDKIEERMIELGDGSKEPLFFKHLENTAFERYALWSDSKDEEVAATASARLIVAGVCDADGKPALTLAQAVRIKRPVMKRMMAALLDVNGYGKRAAEKAGNA